MRISDLDRPVTAAKSHWVPGGVSLDFTPADDSTSARNVCTTAVNRQARSGWILDYVTHAIDKPNPGYEDSEEYREDLRRHEPVAGKIIAVHRLRVGSGRSQREIIGDAAFERTQDMWAKDGNRVRWSVAFPIVESYSIPDQPLANDVFGEASYRRLFAHPATLLRPLNESERAKLADLVIEPRPAANAWIAIEDEAEWAMQDEKEIPNSIRRNIDIDLRGAMEGLARNGASWCGRGRLGMPTNSLWPDKRPNDFSVMIVALIPPNVSPAGPSAHAPS
jgi:5-methylcytosine-specific restriction enzyme A